MQYSWLLNNVLIESGINLQEITINEPGIYCLELLNLETGCSNTLCTEVMQDVAVPVVDAGPDLAITCQDTLITIQGMGPAGPTLEINWTSSGGGCILGASDQLAIETNCPGTYTLTITDPNTGCSGTASMVVTLNNVPPFANAGPDQEINCLETIVILDGSESDTGPNISYNWSALVGNLVSGINTSQPTVDSAGIYELVVTDALTGCTDTSFTFVNEVLDLPMIDIDNPTSLTCEQLAVVIDGSGSAQGDSIVYDWAVVMGGNIVGATNDPLVTVDAGGVYSLTVTNTINGCSVTEEVGVSVDTVAPVATITLTSGTELTCLNPELILDASDSEPTGFLLFDWSTNDGNIVSGVNGVEIVVDSAGTYQLFVENIQNGCVNATSLTIGEDFSAPSPEIAIPDTGSVKEDFREQMQNIVTLMNSSRGEVLASVIGCGQADEELITAFSDIWLIPRRDDAKKIFKRGIERDELREDIDIEAAIDALYSPLFYRLLLKHQPLTNRFVDQLLDIVLRGLEK